MLSVNVYRGPGAILGRRIIVRQANFRYADLVLTELGCAASEAHFLIWVFSSRNTRKRERRFQFDSQTVRSTAEGSATRPHSGDNRSRLSPL